MAMNPKKAIPMHKQMAGYKKGGAVPFEKSAKDVEVKKMGKEGSKKEEAFDAKQLKCGGVKRGK